MKAHTPRRLRLCTFLACCASLPALAGNTWDGGGGNNLWSNSLNWNFDTLPGYGTLLFDGALQTTNVIDSVVNMNQVNWNGAMPWVLNSSGPGHLMLYDNGGTQAKLENFGTVAVTINAPITFAATAGANFGEINAVNGGMNFTGGTLTVDGSAVNGIKFWGGNGNDVSFANTVSASGKWFGFTSTNSQSVTIASGANVTTGDWYVMNGGTLKLAGGTLTTSAVRLGGDFGTTGNQNQALGGTLALTSPTGGINFSGPINAVGGNTSNALLISSQNATGTNTLTGGIFLDSDLKIQQLPGAALTTSTGTFDVKARKLTVEAGAASTVTISQALTSSLAAGGSLVMEGNGTLVLSSTSNNYTGTNTGSLNANGTRIAAGTLAIAGDGSLGLVPGSAYNNVQFTGSGTLRADATMTLNANRGVSIAGGATATFDNNGNSFRINGIIDGTGNAVISGGGTTILAANNTYSGTTTISPGSTLQIGAGSSSGRPGNGSGAIINDGALVVNRTGTYNIANSISGSGSFTKISGGQTAFTGTVSYTGTTTISAGILLVGHSLGGGDIINNAGLIFAHNSAVSVPNNISGSGTVELGGSGGTTIFTGTNTYTGLTTIGGVGTLTLQVGNGGTTGTLGTAGVTGGTGKNIIFNRSDSIIVPNVISVGGSLTQAGAGTTVLTGPNTYSGGTVISAGTLQIGNGGTAGVLGTGAVTNNASLVFNRSDSMTVSQAISGTGSLEQAGTGTIILTGANAYGSTTISAGKLQIGNGGSTGTLGSGSVVNNGEVIFNRTGTVTLSNGMSGTGALTKQNSNTLHIIGTKTYTGTTTISAGTLSLGNPSVDGGTEIITYNNGALSPSSSIVNNATLRFARQTANQGTHFGTISGTGDLRVGYGAVRLDDASNSFSGKISIIPESGIGNNPSITFNSIGNVGGGPSALGAPTTVSSGTIDLGTTSQATAKTASLIYYGSGHTSDRVINLSSQVDDVKLSHIGSGLLKFTSDLTATGAGSKLFELNASSAATGELAGAIPNNSSVNLTSVSKTGSGVWILSGANTYTGSTTISTGTLQIGSGGTSGSISPSSNISISTGARLAFNRSDTVTQGTHFETSLSGGGALRQDGSGTVVLTGTNTYSGGTTISAGTLQIGNGGTSGTLGSGSITNNGTLAVNRSDTVTFTTDIAGTGGFEQMGTGTTVFVGSKSYEGNTLISGGTLQIGNGTSFGAAGIGSITNNGALVLDSDSSAMFSQTVSGSGTLTKNGSGSLQILGGLNTFSGLTTIAEGTLEVMTTNAMGSTAAGTVVQSGATLWLKNHYNAAEPLTLNGTGDGGAGALRTSSGYNVSYAGPITAATDATISVTDSLTLTGGLLNNGNTLTLAGGGTFNINTVGISGTSVFPGILVDGSTVNLNAVSTMQGNITVANGGTLNANVLGALPTGTRTFVDLDPFTFAGSTLALGASQEAAYVAGAYTAVISLGSHTLTVGQGGTSNVPYDGAITGTGSIIKDGTNTWTLEGTSNTYSGSTTLAGGTLGIYGDGSLGAYPLTPTNKIFFTGNATLQDASNHVTLGANRGISIASGVTGTFDATGNTFTIDSVISGSGAATFAGFALSNSVLNGSNTYDGITTVTGAATLHANVNNALGTAAAGTIVNSGAALLLNSVAYTTAEALTINGIGGLNGGALVSSGTSSYAGLITAATHSTIQNSGTLTLTGGLVKDGTTLTLAGNGTYNINSIGISGSSPNSDLVVDGAIVSLNAASSYNGPTYVQNGGTLNANVTGAMPTSPRSAVHLDITGSGGSMLSLGASQEVELVSGVITSAITLGGHHLTVGGNAPSNAPFAGVISGIGGLVKDGTNSWTLTGTSNTYFGSTTLAGGTLGIYGDGSLGAYPASPENKIFFTGNATLQDASNHVTLGANRGISIASGVTATFDATGNTFTIGGAITGDGNLASAGNVVLTGANSYAGTTTVNSGVLSIGAGGTTGSLGAIDVAILGGAELRFNRSNAYTVNHVIYGAGNLTQQGSGTTTLSGDNSYSGITFVNAGILEVTANNALGTTAGGTTVASGAQLRLNNVNYSTAEPLALSGTLYNLGSSTLAGPVQAAGVGIVELGFNTGYSLNLSGGVSVDAGSTFRVGGLGQATVAGISGDSTATVSVIDHSTRLVLSAPSSFGGTFNFGGGSNANTTIQLATANPFSGPNFPSVTSSNPLIGGKLDLNGHSAIIADIRHLASVTNTQAATTSTLTINGSSPYSEQWYDVNDGAGVVAITRAGSGSLTMIGTGYSGLTTIESGTIYSGFQGLGSAASGTVVHSGGALVLIQDTLYTTPEPLTLNGTGISNGGAFSSSGTSSFAGPITIASNATIRNTGTLTLTGGLVKDGTTLTLAGNGTYNINSTGISGSSPNSDLIVDNATVVLNAVNSYNGPTTVQNSGTLRLGISTAMPTAPHSALSLVTGGTFDLNSYSDTIASLNGTGSVINGGPTMSNLTVGGSNGSGSFSGVITGDLSLNKTGSGIQTLSGANTYDGSIAITNVSQGTLNATNSTGSATGGTTVIVTPTGTLAGIGSIQPSTGKSVYLNGTFVVGDATLGSPVASEFAITTTGGGTMNVGSTATLKFDLFTGAGLGNNNATPTAADILTLQGDATFATGSILEIGNPNAMSGWLVGDSWRIWDTTGAGTLSGVLAVVGPNLGGAGFWDFNMATGILSIVAVPEPSRAVLALVGILAVISRRRRS